MVRGEDWRWGKKWGTIARVDALARGSRLHECTWTRTAFPRQNTLFLEAARKPRRRTRSLSPTRPASGSLLFALGLHVASHVLRMLDTSTPIYGFPQPSPVCWKNLVSILAGWLFTIFYSPIPGSTVLAVIVHHTGDRPFHKTAYTRYSNLAMSCRLYDYRIRCTSWKQTGPRSGSSLDSAA